MKAELVSVLVLIPQWLKQCLVLSITYKIS